jgi:hypothetical protein
VDRVVLGIAPNVVGIVQGFQMDVLVRFVSIIFVFLFLSCQLSPTECTCGCINQRPPKARTVEAEEPVYWICGTPMLRKIECICGEDCK